VKQRKNKKLGHAPWFLTFWGLEGHAKASGWD